MSGLQRFGVWTHKYVRRNGELLVQVGASAATIRACGDLLISRGPTRTLCLGRVSTKNFKFKPVQPKLRETLPEELFGEPKGLNIPPGGFFLLIIPVSTLLLGIWQVFRWRWKLELIEDMEKKVQAVPASFPATDLSALEDMEYRKVKLRGTFDYSKEILMGPRSLFNYTDDAGQGGGLFTTKGSTVTGYHVITPFHVEDQNMTILVNRGWISDRNPSKFKGTKESVEIIGVVRKPESRQPFMPKNNPQQSFMMFRDVPAMADRLGTEEAFLDLVSITGFDLSSARLHSLPVPGQTRVSLRNEHVSYFCTWFSLSGITSYMWYKRFILRHALR